MANAPSLLPSPPDPLYRIGRFPDPLALPPPTFVGGGRFDDPQPTLTFRILYTGERLACFYECLAQFRVDLNGFTTQGITQAWLSTRRIARFNAYDPERSAGWLDLMAPASLIYFRAHFPDFLQHLGYTDFDIGVAMTNDRRLTRQIGLWAYEQGCSGIKYATRHAPGLNCWAIFERTRIDVIDPGSPISLDDEDLVTVAQEWNLSLPPRVGAD